MSEEDMDRVYELRRTIEKDIRNVLSRVLRGAKPEVEDLVRTQLGEQFRFWK